MSDRRARLRTMKLYVLLSESHCRLPWRETAEKALAGGADVLQMREKELSQADLLVRARILRDLTEEADALFIVNDRPDVAVLSGADGVHLGQDDLPPGDVRELVGRDMLIGWSTHSPDQAESAELLPVDYIGVGPFAPTETKGYTEGLGADMVRRACARVLLPTVAIGGINRDNAATAVRAGATAVAVCSAVCGAEDPEAAARELHDIVTRAAGGRDVDA